MISSVFLKFKERLLASNNVKDFFRSCFIIFASSKIDLLECKIICIVCKMISARMLMSLLRSFTSHRKRRGLRRKHCGTLVRTTLLLQI